jgi:hypothetical protein
MNMFSTTEHKAHSQKKRTMANVYSKSYIASSPQVAANSHALFTTRFLPMLQKFGESGESVDVHSMNNAITMDFMSAYQFGLAAASNLTQDVAFRDDIMYKYHCRRDYEFFGSEIHWFRRLTKRLGCPVIPQFAYDADEQLEAWNVDMCRGAEKYLDNGSSFAGDEPVVYKQFKLGMFKAREKDPGAGMTTSGVGSLAAANNMDTTIQEVYSEMLDHLGAGHETSAICLTYLYWEMSKDVALQDMLRQELATLTPILSWPLPAGKSPAKDFALPDPKQIDALPFLDAIVMETLRLHTPIPGIEPRVSPHVPGGNTLGAYSDIPGGVRVSSMPYTLHRNPAVFKSPESFNPFRWLPDHTPPEQLKEMHRWFWAFGSGGRMCIGSHLALQEIKLLVSAIYTNWTTEIVNDEGIEEIDAYTTKPRRNRLDLKFQHTNFMYHRGGDKWRKVNEMEVGADVAKVRGKEKRIERIS